MRKDELIVEDFPKCKDMNDYTRGKTILSHLEYLRRQEFVYGEMRSDESGIKGYVGSRWIAKSS